MMLRHIAIAAAAVGLVLIAPRALAQTVQKCQGRDGHVRYQSEPCSRREKTLETWDATPDPVPTRRSTRAASMRSRSRRTSFERVAMQPPESCAAAKAWRDAAERHAGMSRNYDLLTTLQRRVFDACR